MGGLDALERDAAIFKFVSVNFHVLASLRVNKQTWSNVAYSCNLATKHITSVFLFYSLKSFIFFFNFLIKSLQS